MERGNIIGEEDMISKQKVYRTTVKCISIDGVIGQMKREDFFRLEHQVTAWRAIVQNAAQKDVTI